MDVVDEFAFNLDGDLTVLQVGTDPELSFDYDESGRLKKITEKDGETVLSEYEYIYGPDEVRVGCDIDTDGNGNIDISRRFFSDGLVTYQVDNFTGDLEFAVVYAQDGFTPVFYITFANNLVDDVYYYISDHLSTPRALIDDTGVIVWQARYAPFGGIGDGSTPDFNAGDIGIDADPGITHPLRFPGQWDDGIEGIWYNHHRFYLSEYGMYGRRDPIPRVDGNMFSYAGGNPVMAVDPMGVAGVVP